MSLNQIAFETFPVLETKRLALREFTLADAEQIFAMRADPRVSAFIRRAVMAEPKDASELVEKVLQSYKDKNGIGWAGALKDSDLFIGSVGLIRIDHDNMHAEIGGEMLTEYWGRRFALEATQPVIQYAFKTLGLHKLDAWMFPQNRSAIHLLEHFGFVKCAHLQDHVWDEDHWQDMVIYSLVNPNH